MRGVDHPAIEIVQIREIVSCLPPFQGSPIPPWSFWEWLPGVCLLCSSTWSSTLFNLSSSLGGGNPNRPEKRMPVAIRSNVYHIHWQMDV